MALFVEKGESIEGKKVRLETRKNIFKKPIHHKELGLLYKYKTAIRSIAEIICELEPKKAIILQEPHLDIGDQLNADGIEIYTKKILKPDIIGGATSTHKAQSIEMDKHTAAEIFMPYDIILTRIKKSTM